MDDHVGDIRQPSPRRGVDGLGYTGRPADDDAPTPAGDDVAGLGFGGRDAPDEYNGDRFSGDPHFEPDTEPGQAPEIAPDEEAD